MHKTIVANWKMNPRELREARSLARVSDKAHVVVCPPFPFLVSVREVLRHAALGAQDCFWEEKGPYTGEVSPAALKRLGVHYVIIGHSERRTRGETDGIVARKLAAAARAGLTPILCVGETAEEKSRGEAHAAVKRQLAAVKKRFPLIVAYEPVWAIGTGVADTPADTVTMVAYIRSLLYRYTSPLAVLYGGSVNRENAEAFLSRPEIGGALVGGASITTSGMRAIMAAASRQYGHS